MNVAWGGSYLGCGYCGAMVPEEYGDWPDCCPAMADWKRRLRDCVFGPDYVEAPPPEVLHEMARWERVARRISGKHKTPVLVAPQAPSSPSVLL